MVGAGVLVGVNGVAVAVGVSVGVLLGVFVTVLVGVFVNVGIGVAVFVGVLVAVAVLVGVIVAVGVGVNAEEGPSQRMFELRPEPVYPTSEPLGADAEFKSQARSWAGVELGFCDR